LASPHITIQSETTGDRHHTQNKHFTRVGVVRPFGDGLLNGDKRKKKKYRTFSFESLGLDGGRRRRILVKWSRLKIVCQTKRNVETNTLIPKYYSFPRIEAINRRDGTQMAKGLSWSGRRIVYKDRCTVVAFFPGEGSRATEWLQDDYKDRDEKEGELGGLRSSNHEMAWSSSGGNR